MKALATALTFAWWAFVAALVFALADHVAGHRWPTLLFIAALLAVVFAWQLTARAWGLFTYWLNHRDDLPYVRELGPYRAEEKDAA